MACYLEQGHTTPAGGHPVLLSATDPVNYTLTSGANGTPLTGSADTVVVSSSESGWFRVSGAAATKAAVGIGHRISSGIPMAYGGITAGMFASWLADA